MVLLTLTWIAWVLGCTAVGVTGQEDLKVTMMDRQSLHEYSLAKCGDGSPAAYYIEKDLSFVAKNVMIFFDNSVDKFSNPIQPCTSVDDCLDICNSSPEACTAPAEATKLQRDGVWSRERQNNPFAEYFKVYLPSCTLDDFSGARGPLFGANGGKLFFHGRHIFSSLLRDLVAKYGIDQAQNLVLVGSGSGARGVGHSCDYFSEAIATVNPNASVKCVLDSPDLIPFWLHDEVAHDRCNENQQEAFIEEATKSLWGRTDDESCVRELEPELNETSLARTCGMFSQYWKYVQSPMFLIASQWNELDFNRITCNVPEDDEDYFTYNTLWRQGIMTLIQVMSLQQPANGWFIPNCQDQVLFLSDTSIEQRQNVQVPLFVTGQDRNVLQVLNSWLTQSIEVDEYQAINQFGLPDEACSSNLDAQRSQPLKKKSKDGKKSAKQRIVPLDPLDDVPVPKGFPDGPPPKPSDPIDTLFSDGNKRRFDSSSLTKIEELLMISKSLADPFSSDRFLGLFGNSRQPGGQGIRNQGKKNKDHNDLLPKGVSDAEIVLGAELFRRQMAEQQRRRRPGNNVNVNDDYRQDSDYDFLYYLYNLYRQPTRQSGTDAIFDPIDPSTPEFFDYDYDVNVNNFGSGSSVGTPTPSGILPEQAVALANTRSRKARLWRKVYYLQYLRELYRRTYADYYNDYYYGIQGSGNFGRLTKADEE